MNGKTIVDITKSNTLDSFYFDEVCHSDGFIKNVKLLLGMIGLVGCLWLF